MFNCGKYWLLPGGGAVDVTASEHAIYARKAMLGLPHDDRTVGIRNMCSTLSDKEAKDHRLRGVSEDVLTFLSANSESNDPRVYAINTWGWVRVRLIRKTTGLWLRSLDDRMLHTIRGASEFWKGQNRLTDHDMFDVHELASDACYVISAYRLRSSNFNIANLRATAFQKRPFSIE